MLRTPRAEARIAVKAVTAAQLSLASDGVYSVTLDEAIEAMRVTAADMSVRPPGSPQGSSHSHASCIHLGQI